MMKTNLYVVVWVFFILLKSSTIYSNNVIDYQSAISFQPDQLIGKRFIFLEASESYKSNCFFTQEAIEKNDYSKKYIFAKDGKGFTPSSEYYNHVFTATRIIFPNDDEISNGFVLELKRDDGIIMGLKFNKFKTNKKYKASNPSFSDLFIATTFYEGYPNFFTGKPTKKHKTSLQIKVFDLDDISDLCAKLTTKYNQEEVFIPYTTKIHNYNLDSISQNSTQVLLYFREDDSVTVALSPHNLRAKIFQRDSDINQADTIQRCIDKYDKEEILYIKERLIGKPLWAKAGIYSNTTYFYKPNNVHSRETNVQLWGDNYRSKPFDWLDPYKGLYGSGITKFEGNILNVINSYYATNCIIEDIVLSENCLIGRVRNRKDVKGTIFDNDYCYYLVLKRNPDKEYLREGNHINEEDSKVYVMVENGISKLFISDIENELNLEAHRAENRRMNKERNEQFHAIYTVAERLWGDGVAKLIQHGEVRFGFSSDMCIMANQNEPYRIGKVSTPFGLATCYDFFQKEEKLYFINDELIGIQFKLGKIRFR